MPRRLAEVLLVLFALSFAVHVSGCSVLGLGIGALVDNTRSQRLRAVSNVQITQVRRHDQIVAVLEDSTRVAGEFAGWSTVPSAEYAALYEAWRAAQPESAFAPALGERVRVREGATWDTGELAHFGFGFVELRSGRRHEFREASRAHVADARGRSARFGELLADQIDGRMPTASRLRIQAGDSASLVDPGRIARLELPAAKHGKVIGFTVGLVVDGILVAAAANSSSGWGGGDCSGVNFGTPY